MKFAPISFFFKFLRLAVLATTPSFFHILQFLLRFYQGSLSNAFVRRNKNKMKIVSESQAKLIKKVLLSYTVLKLILGMARSEVDWRLNLLSFWVFVDM